jgi:hypothetical protein
VRACSFPEVDLEFIEDAGSECELRGSGAVD